MKHLKECLACGGANLTPYIFLGSQPLANSYSESPLTRDQYKTYNLQVKFCNDCSHSQLGVIVDPEEMFSSYKYVSGTTQTLKEHFLRLARKIHEQYDDTAGTFYGMSVLDIGCNDGTLMECFIQEAGNITKDKVFGIDPAAEMQEFAKTKGLNIIQGYWSADTAFSMGEYDIITACNVFAHNYDPLDFLKGCKRVLNLTGKVYIEFPYGKNTIQENQFDQFYHEHVNYFTVKSFATLCERAGFVIQEIIESPVHGGSIRFVLFPGNWAHCLKTREYIKKEKDQALHDIGNYNLFDSVVKMNLAVLKDKVDELSQTHKVVMYGASAKSTVLLNCPETTGMARRIEFAVDDNPAKVGLFCPGSNLEIKSSAELSNIKEDIVLILGAWNFSEEIIKRIKRLRPENNDTVISYIPKVQVKQI